MKLKYPLFLLFLIACNVYSVLCHTPLDALGDGDSILSSIEILNPTKSWTLYRELHESGEFEYFKVYLYPNERLYISLFTPVREDPNFSPCLAIMGENFSNSFDLPDEIQVPIGYGVLIVEGTKPENPEFEPFTPTSYYYHAKADILIVEEGFYYFAVYAKQVGHLGLAIGYREEFALVDMITLPFSLINIHIWEYQSLFIIILPLLLVLFLGSSMIYLRMKTGATIIQAIGAFAGILYAGTGFMTLYQLLIAYTMAPSSTAILTLGISLLQLIPGYYLIRKSLKGYGLEYLNDRILYILIGVLGLVTWAGFIIGPILAISVGLIGRRDFWVLL